MRSYSMWNHSMFSFAILVFVTFAGMVGVVQASECNIKPEPMSAVFSKSSAGRKSPPQVKSIHLQRSTKRVAIDYKDKNITELWELTKDKRLRLVKYFNEEKRGIAYQPNEIKSKGKENDWSAKQQLLSDNYLQTLDLVATSGFGCNVVEHYRRTVGDTAIEVEYLKHLKLIKRYQVKKPDSAVLIQLTDYDHTEKPIEEYFTRLSKYKTTDYADIDDKESDPFLLKMKKLGLVEPMTSGF